MNKFYSMLCALAAVVFLCTFSMTYPPPFVTATWLDRQVQDRVSDKIEPLAMTALPAIPWFTVSSSTGAIYFSWTELTGITHYAVEFKNGNTFVAIPGAESLSSTTTHFVWKGLSKNSSYTVRVIAVNSSGATSAPSITVKTMVYDFLLPYLAK